MIDKKKFIGGKIEQRSDYYNLLMRKKETKIMQRLTQQKFNAAAAIDNVFGVGLFEIEGTSGSATKEQQLKLLTDILSKIERLESGVRQQVNKQRQVLGLGNSQMGHYMETSSAHKSTNSFMTGSRYGGGSTFMK